ncbi:HTH-type transcriptional regulator MtrA [Burkholderiales bacterium]|nr:HTH-type transcriptional regulator MtrA [Burkholderiales bacterium]
MSRDTLSELLRAVRLRGAIFYYVDGVEPWVAEAPPACEMAPAIMPGVDHLIEFHVVTRGSCYGGVVGAEPVPLGQGDVIMFPQGDPHVMSSAPGMRARAVDPDLYFSPRPPQLPYVLERRGEDVVSTVRLDGGGASGAQVVCGFLGCDARPFNPLVAALPRMIHVPGAAERDSWITEFVRIAVAEASDKRPGGEAMLERLSEMMFVGVLRRYLEALAPGQTGWLAGLRDRFVGRALALLHEQPTRKWTIEELGESVGLSRSALHDRFVELVGQPPIQYLAQWRMQLASRKLVESTMNVAAIAQEVGYESEAAFNRAFRRTVGMPPAAWRRARAAR